MSKKGRAFIHGDSEAAVAPFHYTQCGLDDVYLLSGFELSEHDGEPWFSIKNMDGLHKAIALVLVRERATFSGKDVRFLRKQMKLTQEELGELIGVGDQMVARYEKGESNIPPAPAMLLRMRYLASVTDDHETVKELKRMIAEIEETVRANKAGKPIVLRAVRGTEWNVAA